jgi:hypothetical protein
MTANEREILIAQHFYQLRLLRWFRAGIEAKRLIKASQK